MENVQLWIGIILGGMAVMTNIFLAYNHFAKKDYSFDKQLGINSAACSLKHKIIDNNYFEIKQSFANLTKELQLFKENGLVHIEQEQRRLSEVQVKILTILEERNKKI